MICAFVERPCDPFDPSLHPFSMQRKHVNRFCEFSLSTVIFGEYDLRARILIIDRNCFTDLAVNPLGESIWTAA